MNVLDSSCWLEVAKKSPIGEDVAPIIADAERLFVPTIALYEVFKILAATHGEDYANGFVRVMLDSQVVPLDTSLSVHAANVSRKYKLPMADSIIYATAIQHDTVLWTTDQHFDGLPSVRYFDKTQQ